ncbi:MAG: hypothetical protein ACRCU6_12545 [Fusobacteriaceae bacterium]
MRDTYKLAKSLINSLEANDLENEVLEKFPGTSWIDFKENFLHLARTEEKQFWKQVLPIVTVMDEYLR